MRIETETLIAENPTEVERWRALVLNSSTPDVYYLPETAQAASQMEHSEPMAVVTGPDSCRFLAPLLVRRMSADIQWADACSPYGYGGLLPLAGCHPSADDLCRFTDGLRAWCAERELVCCVIRLHPLMRQDEWFTAEEQGLVRVRMRGNTTAIDLLNWDEGRDCPLGMRKGRYSDLNTARRALCVRWSSGEDHDAAQQLECFAALYNKSMEARGSGDFYRFPPGYFRSLAPLGRHLGVASAWLEGELAGASIFLAGRDYAHYHLAAVNEIGMKHKAASLLVVEGARWARRQGCRLLHLGGGLNPGDSLEDFKRSFGGQLYRYAYLICIADPERYEQLCQLPNAPWPYGSSRT